MNITEIEWTKNHKNEIKFINSWVDENYYLSLKDGDLTCLFFVFSYLKNHHSLFIISPIPIECFVNIGDLKHNAGCNDCKIIMFDGIECTVKVINDEIQTDIDSIIPDFSKYIPEDNATLFLCPDDYIKYKIEKLKNIFLYQSIEDFSSMMPFFKKVSIIIRELDSKNIEEANNIAKELKERYGVECITIIAIHYFLNILSFKWKIWDTIQYIAKYIDKLITTNSTGILEAQKTERLHVIDCLEFLNQE